MHTDKIDAPAKNLAHMRWLVERRSENQQCCLKLFELLEKNRSTWEDEQFFAAQDMVGAAFSLWRAVFLGEKLSKRKLVYQHFRDFLGGLIEDNAISYVQDKKNREWTFNYYVENARFRLDALAKRRNGPGKLKAWTHKKRSATKRWEYAQSLLDDAIQKYSKHLGS
ncbi:hypothetical protein [Dongia sedimenti]|uniref:Uncharacterized protein n=1 Tax=Dongia sedimenti TaxID=3064282 RepID=A0ABU0YS62_9PROT|nr:hypothetical protein [Rhodospirillaceae bacterium R-7]